MEESNRYQILARVCLIILACDLAIMAQSRTVFLSSPDYTIDIGFSMTGTCDPYNGSNFKRLDLYGNFSDMGFVGSPGGEPPCFLKAKGGPASMQIQGRGEIRGFDLCPAWEEEQTPIPGKVIRGPKAFKPTLQVITREEAQMRLEEGQDDPMVPMPIVPSVWLKFTTSFSVKGEELAWEHPHLSTNQIEDFTVIFSLPLKEIGKGQYISLTVPYKGEVESGKWEITMVAKKK